MSSVTYFPELYIFSFMVLIIYTTAAAAFEHYKVLILHKKAINLKPF